MINPRRSDPRHACAAEAITVSLCIICDSPQQNQPYCAGYQSEIQAYLVAQGDNYHFSLFGMDQ